MLVDRIQDVPLPHDKLIVQASIPRTPGALELYVGEAVRGA